MATSRSLQNGVNAHALMMDARDIFSDVIFFHRTHIELSVSLTTRIYTSSYYLKLPQYMKSRVQGYIDCLRDDLNRSNKLEWWLWDKLDEKLVDSKDWTQWRLDDGSPRIDGDKSCHVWAGTNGEKVF